MLEGKDMCGRSNNSISRAPDHDGAHSYYEKERRCQAVFDGLRSRYGEFWHLCTPGENQQIIFSSKEEYEAGMQVVAICALKSPDIGIITFELMSNHFHFVVCGAEKNVQSFFGMLRRRLAIAVKYSDRRVDLSGLKSNLIAIHDLESLRNHIIYCNRNNYVIDDSQLPFSYPFGANSFYFNPSAKKRKDAVYGDLSFRDKRLINRSHSLDYPEGTLILDNYFSPISYCFIQDGERLFRDARHHFTKLGKNVESMKDIALMSGETVFYTDDELMAVVRGICKTTYGCASPSLLPIEDKLNIIRTLHYDYRASNAKISRMLKIPQDVICSLFPLNRK